MADHGIAGINRRSAVLPRQPPRQWRPIFALGQHRAL